MARRAQVVTRRILHRMYHQCGNTDTYLSSPLPSPPNPRRIASEPTNPLVPAVHDLTLAASSFLPSLSSLDSTFSPNSARFPLPSFPDIPLYDLRASASCSPHPTNREGKRVGRCTRLHVYRQRTRGRSWTSRRRRRFLVTRLC